MKKRLALSLAAVLALAALTVPLAAQATGQADAQDKSVDMKKLLAEIAGEYSFDFQGQTLVVEFVVQEGKLFGAPPGEALEEIRPVEGKPRCFDVTVAGNGQYFFLEFVRNDQGVIAKCLLTVQDTILEGTKIIK